jgi:hypothetical protein
MAFCRPTADSIDDLGVIRTGGMGRLFGGVYAPTTLGQLLREFTMARWASVTVCWSRMATIL